MRFNKSHLLAYLAAAISIPSPALTAPTTLDTTGSINPQTSNFALEHPPQSFRILATRDASPSPMSAQGSRNTAQYLDVIPQSPPPQYSQLEADLATSRAAQPAHTPNQQRPPPPGRSFRAPTEFTPDPARPSLPRYGRRTYTNRHVPTWFRAKNVEKLEASIAEKRLILSNWKTSHPDEKSDTVKSISNHLAKAEEELSSALDAILSSRFPFDSVDAVTVKSVYHHHMRHANSKLVFLTGGHRKKYIEG